MWFSCTLSAFNTSREFEIPHKGVYQAQLFKSPTNNWLCYVWQFSLHSQSLCKEKIKPDLFDIWSMPKANHHDGDYEFHTNNVLIKPNISHSTQVSIWNYTQVCVRETVHIPHKQRLCVACELCLNNRGCCMSIYIMESKEINSLQDDTRSLPISDAPYLMRISGNLIVSSPSTQVTIQDFTQGCDFHAHFFRIPHKSWIEIPHKGVHRSIPFQIPHEQLMCCVWHPVLLLRNLCSENRPY